MQVSLEGVDIDVDIDSFTSISSISTGYEGIYQLPIATISFQYRIVKLHLGVYQHIYNTVKY